MSEPNSSPIRIQFGFRGWAAIVVAMAILAAIAFLAIGSFVFFLPVLIIAPIFYWLMPKPKPISNPMSNDIPRPGNDADIIEGEFTVVSATGVERQLESADRSEP
jgi:hypothetical protein